MAVVITPCTTYVSIVSFIYQRHSTQITRLVEPPVVAVTPLSTHILDANDDDDLHEAKNIGAREGFVRQLR